MNFTTIMVESHSGIRWIVVLLGLIVLAKSLYGWLSTTGYTPLDRRLWLWFNAAFGIQILLGFIVLVLLGAYSGLQFEHLTIMLVAAGLTMVATRWKEAADAIKHRNFTFLMVVIFALVYVAVWRVGGWPWHL